MKKYWLLLLLKRAWGIKQKGFSLLELIIVIALLTIISAITINIYTGSQAIQVRAELDKLRALFLYAQQKACITKVNYVVKVNHNKYGLYVENKPIDAISFYKYKFQGFAYKNKQYSCVLTDQLSKNVVFKAPSFILGPPGNPVKHIFLGVTFVDHMIFFYPDGTISSGVIYLSDKKYNNTYALSCSISQVSFIRCYKYDYCSNKWLYL